MIEGAADAGQALFVSPVVLCELVWVLESAYGVGRAEVISTLDALLRTAQLEFGDKDVLSLEASGLFEAL